MRHADYIEKLNDAQILYAVVHKSRRPARHFPSGLSEIVETCWLQDYRERPNFDIVIEQLFDLLSDVERLRDGETPNGTVLAKHSDIELADEPNKQPKESPKSNVGVSEERLAQDEFLARDVFPTPPRAQLYTHGESAFRVFASRLLPLRQSHRYLFAGAPWAISSDSLRDQEPLIGIASNQRSPWRFFKIIWNQNVVIVKRLKSSERVAGQLLTLVKGLDIGYAINHENLLLLFGAGRDSSGSPFLVVPSMPGGTISEYLINVQEEAFVKTALRLLIQTCKGMPELHRQGVFHGDLRGANTLVNENGTAVVSGFISLRSREVKAQDESNLHSSGNICQKEVDLSTITQGSLSWMAPERLNQTRLEGRLRFAADVYSFGTTCCEVFSGENPLVFLNEEDEEILEGYQILFAITMDNRRPSRPERVDDNQSGKCLANVGLQHAQREAKMGRWGFRSADEVPPEGGWPSRAGTTPARNAEEEEEEEEEEEDNT
ncbi:kinase-like domain-containing protein, partial [Blyttiomyces helicus]